MIDVFVVSMSWVAVGIVADAMSTSGPYLCALERLQLDTGLGKTSIL